MDKERKDVGSDRLGSENVRSSHCRCLEEGKRERERDSIVLDLSNLNWEIESLARSQLRLGVNLERNLIDRLLLS